MMPGISLPSSSSSEAPPPVETCVTLSSVSYFLHAVAVSPPPITVMVPAVVTSTILSIISLVPFSKAAISNTPIGPFQMMVLLAAMAAALSSTVLGPQSRPIIPSGTPPSNVAVSMVPSSPNLDDTTKSTGNTISTFSFLALSMISLTILAPSSSYSDEPMDIPCKTFRNVKAMPPPMIILSTLASKFLMRRILSLTLAPPRIARTGFDGQSSTLPKAASSLATRKPAALTSKPSPTMEECARCAVPKASLT
mmetsp:Transcript_18131/g.38949  ORF Transcript_18131/g.38949 Transcript_18131/m.38949 type:complete len:252 (-) Transcript_18131:524-1279(-)